MKQRINLTADLETLGKVLSFLAYVQNAFDSSHLTPEQKSALDDALKAADIFRLDVIKQMLDQIPPNYEGELLVA
jgi:hypothetical protein